MSRLVVSSTLAVALLLGSMARAQLVPNSNPRFTAGTDVVVNEDSGTYQAPWATGLSDGEGAGGAHSGTQSLRFDVVAANPALFSSQPTIDTANTAAAQLTFTPAPDAFGTTTVTVTLRDSGTAVCVPGGNNAAGCPNSCVPSDCSASATVTFTITILPVNDCPTFQIRGDQTVLEDSGQSTINGFAYSVDRGAANENTQTVTFTATAADTSLFAVQPQITWDPNNPTAGQLTFTPAADAHGQTTVSVVARDNGGTANGGCDQSTTTTFNIIITPVNDRPSFTFGRNPVTHDEDAGPFTEAPWATQISPGPANEAPQTVNFNLQLVDPTTANLFSVQPAINPNTGALTFTPADNANTFGRTVQVYVQAQDNGGDSPNDFSCFPITSCPTLTIVINPVNDAPSFTPGGDINVYEDLMNYAIPPVPPIYSDGNAWATNIDVGAPNEGIGANNEGQMAEFRLTNNNQGLFEVQPRIDPRGTLYFQLRENAWGCAVVSVNMFDTGIPQVPAANNPTTFDICVQPVNDPPSFIISHPNPLVVNEDIGPVDILVWATEAVPGPVETHACSNTGPDCETTQILEWVAEPTDTSFFMVQPTIASINSGTGRLQFQTSPNVWGRTDIRVVLRDNGGVERKGVDYFARTLTIIVNSVNDPPAFLLAETEVSIYEQANPTTYSRGGMAFNITAGGFQEGGDGTSVNVAQNVRFLVTVNNEHLFSVLPAISNQGGLTFTPAANKYGDAIVTVIAQDDNLPPASSDGQTFTIRILPVNNPPIFSTGGDITGRQITMCQTTGACLRTFASYITGISAGPDVNEASQTITFSAIVPPAFQPLFDQQPTIDSSTGNLAFTLALNRYTEPGNPVPIVIQARDNGGTANGGVDTTLKTMTMVIQKMESPPQFQPGADQVVLEDSGRHVVAGWATNVQRGPIDTSTAGLSFRMSVTDPTLFSEQPAVTLDAGNTGTLSFQSAPNKYGSSLIQITLDNGLNSQSSQQYTFTITVTPVNDQPVFTSRGNIIVYESSGAYRQQWINTQTPGPYEGQQTIDYTINCDSTTVFSVNPTVNALGEMQFTLQDAQSGMTPCTATAQDSGPITNNGVNQMSETFTITVRSINNAPSFTHGNDISVLEGSGARSFPNWAQNMNAGAGDTNQVLNFVISTTNDAMFFVPVRIDATTGTLTFTLADGMNGNVYVDVSLMDNGPTSPTDSNQSPTHRMLIVVTPVNSQPMFTLGNDVSVLENSGLYIAKGWATGIAAGPINENHQSLRFTLTAANTALFALTPSIDPSTGDLQFSTATGANGVSSVQVCLQDNGGLANGGVDQLCTTTMSISVVSVNGAPTAVIPPTVTVFEDRGVFSQANFLTGVTPGSGAGESSQLITGITVSVPIAYQSYFKTQPTIALGSYTLAFETVENFFGEIVCSVSIVDNGGVNNGGVNTFSGSFRLVVLPVNDRPSFVAGVNVVVPEDSATYQGIWASNIVAGPANEATQSVVFSCTNNNPAMFNVAPSIDTSGYLSFLPSPNANGVVTVSVILKDDGGVANNGFDSTLPVTFTITLSSINDKPSFVAGPTITIDEDSSAFVYRAWASNIFSGPVDEQLVQRVLNFTVTPADPSYFSVQPVVNYPSGDLTFTVAANKFGVTTMTVMLSDNAIPVPATASAVMTLVVNEVNDAPTFTTSGDITVNEDAGDQIIVDYITSSSAGPYETTQTISFTVTSSDITKFASPPRIVGRNLLFTTAQDANGVIVLTINATDRSGGMNHWYVANYNLNVIAVNDAPSFIVGEDISVNENSGITRFPKWLKDVTVPGPKDELSQLLTPYWTVVPEGVLAQEPTLDLSTNVLTIQVLPNRFGSLEASLYYKDDGGVVNEGKDTSLAQTFNIDVLPVNDAPTFNPGLPVLYISSSTTSYSAPWASNISAGPFEDTIQSTNFDVVADNLYMFTPNGRPQISSANGVLSFTINAGAYGNTTLAVTLRDSAGATSETSYITLVVASYAGPDLIVVTLTTEFSAFDRASFRNSVVQALGIEDSQMVIHSVVAGSTIVTFQLIGKAGVSTSEELTRNFLSLVNANTVFRTNNNIHHVTIKPYTLGAAQDTAAPAPNTVAGSSSFNYVALAIGLFAAVAFIALAIFLVYSYKKRQDEKKGKNLEEKPVRYVGGGAPPTSNQYQVNPVQDFGGAASNSPYDDPSTPPLQQGRANRWGTNRPATNETIV